MRLIDLLVLVTAALILQSCESPPASTPGPFDNRPGTAAVEAPSLEAGGDSLASTRLPEATAEVFLLSVATEGFLLVNSRTGSTRPLPFGSPRSQVIDAVTTVRGSGETQPISPDCGVGFQESASWGGGLTTWFQDDAFIGWSLSAVRASPVGASSVPITTMSGIGVGSTRAELEGAYSAQFQETSLGTEFSAGGIFGVVSSANATGEITNLWAGTTCIFR